MVKLLLYAVILLSCGGLGMMKAHRYADRLRDLEDLKHMASLLETEMRYRKDPLPRVFVRIAAYKDNRATSLLSACAAQMESHQAFHRCWETAVEQTYNHSALTSEDLHILGDMGLQLGKSGIQGQGAMFALFTDKLNRQIQEAVREATSKGKMYKSLGFAAGVVVVILLI